MDGAVDRRFRYLKGLRCSGIHWEVEFFWGSRVFEGVRWREHGGTEGKESKGEG